MCSVSVLCPLCAQSSFASIDALRVSLIRAANGPLPCPICHELFLGLDKLTIHLFSHTDIFAIATQGTTTHSISVAAVSDEKSQNFVPSPRIISAHTLQNDPVGSKESQEIVSKKPQKCSTGGNGLVGEAMVQVKKESWQNLPTCDICEFNFRNKELLELHFRLVHQNDVSSPADTSQSLNTSVDLSSGHKKVHEFKCHLCAKTFKMKGSLRVHLKVVHLIGFPVGSNTSKPSICDRIRTNTQKDEATSNQNTSTLPHHTTKLPLFVESPSQAHSILTLQSNFNSNECTMTTNAAGSMLMTANSPQESPSTVVVAFSNISSAEQPEVELELDKDNVAKANSENAKIWECDVCSKAFTTKYFLKKHKRLHTGEMPYTCEICARTFTFQQSYHKHLLYHSDEKPHVCVTCGRAFKELSTLHNHERIHSGEKPFKCDVCEKSFRQRVSFLVHTRIHTGVMPYKCDVCQKSFRYKVSQRTHKCLPNTVHDAGTLGDDKNAETSEQISECFIKAFLESASATAMHESQNSPHSMEIAAINAMDVNDGQLDVKHVMDEAMLSKTIDDIVVESCNKMGIGNTAPVLNLASTSNGLCDSVVCSTDGHNSPSLKFQNMRLYSPVLLQQQVAAIVNATNDETSDFSHFLLDDARNEII